MCRSFFRTTLDSVSNSSFIPIQIGSQTCQLRYLPERISTSKVQPVSALTFVFIITNGQSHYMRHSERGNFLLVLPAVKTFISCQVLCKFFCLTKYLFSHNNKSVFWLQVKTFYYKLNFTECSTSLLQQESIPETGALVGPLDESDDHRQVKAHRLDPSQEFKPCSSLPPKMPQAF